MRVKRKSHFSLYGVHDGQDACFWMLLLAAGAGAESRQPISILVVFGIAITALLTLFVVPALYSLMAQRTRSPQYVARLIRKLKRATRRAEAARATQQAGG